MNRATRRLLVGLGIVVAEYIVLGVAFDGGTIVDAPGWWSKLNNVGELVRMLATVATAALVLEGAALAERLRSASVAVEGYDWTWGTAHACVFSSFSLLTQRVFAGAPSAVWAPWLLAAWAFCGIAVVFTAFRFTLGSALRLALAGTGRALRLGLLLGGVAWLAAIRAYSSWASLWDAMASWTLQLSAAWLRPWSSAVRVDEATTTLEVEGFSVIIGFACSGVEGLTMMAVFCSGYLYRFRRNLRFPRAFLLLPIGLAAVWLANTLRIAVLAAIGAWFSPEIALGAFHSKAGWLFFCTLAFGLAFLADRSSFFSKTARPPADGVENPTAAYCVPLLALLALGMLTGAFAGALDYFYPVRILVAAAAVWGFRQYYARFDLRQGFPWQAVAIGVVVFALWLALAPARDSARNAAFARALGDLGALPRACWFTFRVLGAVLVVPLVEELAFRGYLQRRMLAEDFTEVSPRRFSWLSLIATSLAFGSLHASWVAGAIAGAAYSLATYARGFLGDAVVAHATTNALLAAWVLAFQRWDLW
jgi:exosortase E/protease (VPEID-CTERM system)